MPEAESIEPGALENAADEERLQIDGVAMGRLLGPQDRLLTTIQREYPGVEVHVRGNEITLSGEADAVARARALVAEMTAAAAIDPARTVAFQGAPGANSHIAAREAFPDGLPLPCFDFADAIDAVRDFRADCAMIPIENSLHGRVADMHFLLPESGLVITGEHFLSIRHALMGLGTRDQVREAMSHPQGSQLRVSRQELARLVGCSREMAGRVLKKLQTDGLLHARGKTVVLYGTR